MAVYLGAAKWQPSHRDELALTCLDVGHGQAILLQLPGGANVLFDAGSLHRADIGTRIVAPYLDHAGVGKIDAIVISHNDVDHINGIPEIIERCEVEHVYANDAFFDRTDAWGTAKFLRNWLSERGLGVKHLRGDLKLAQNAGIRILWPDERIGGDETLGDNDRSLVSLIEFAGIRIILCSDIEQFPQKELLRRHPNLSADVVVVPHHGSARTLVPEFLKKLDASILICSCDRSQYERSNNVLIRAADSKLFHTSEDGAITIRVKKDGTVQTECFAE
jgi:competence protein ComEC